MELVSCDPSHSTDDKIRGWYVYINPGGEKISKYWVKQYELKIFQLFDIRVRKKILAEQWAAF